jgi:hypothetical protein
MHETRDKDRLTKTESNRERERERGYARARIIEINVCGEFFCAAFVRRYVETARERTMRVVNK